MSNHKQLVRLQNGELLEINFQYKELIKREFELCTKCPLIKGYIPIIGNCINTRIRQDGRRRRYDIRLYGEPSNYWHEVFSKCSHVIGMIFNESSGDLRAIVCGLQESSNSSNKL